MGPRIRGRHGGVISVRRQDMNELRAAIAERDAAGMLEAMTQQRSTFTADQLARALQKEIQASRGATAEQKQSVDAVRPQFQAEILAHAEVIRLADRMGRSRATLRAPCLKQKCMCCASPKSSSPAPRIMSATSPPRRRDERAKQHVFLPPRGQSAAMRLLAHGAHAALPRTLKRGDYGPASHPASGNVEGVSMNILA